MARPGVDHLAGPFAPSRLPGQGPVKPLVVAAPLAICGAARSSKDPDVQPTKEAHPDGAA